MRAISSSVLLVGFVVGFVSWKFVLGADLLCARLRISIKNNDFEETIIQLIFLDWKYVAGVI